MNKIAEQIKFFNQKGILIKRVCAFVFWLFVLNRFIEHALPHQFVNPVYKNMGNELSYIAFAASGMADLIAKNAAVSIFISLALFCLPLLIIKYPNKAFLGVLFSIFWIMFVLFTNVYGQSNSYLTYSILFSVLFWFKINDNFSFIWLGLRYYACWIYFSTFFLKVINGAFWQADNGYLAFKTYTLEHVFAHQQNNWLTSLIYFLMNYPMLINIGAKLTFIAEGLFLIGFFTRKFDRLLIACCVFIFLTTTLFIQVWFIENLFLFILVFTRPKTWIWLQEKFNYFFKGLSGSLAK